HVRAGNQQHESDGAEERKEGWFYLANKAFVERRNKYVPAFVSLVKLLVELRIDGAETSLRLLQIDTGIQTRDRRPHAVIARFIREEAGHRAQRRTRSSHRRAARAPAPPHPHQSWRYRSSRRRCSRRDRFVATNQ